MEKLGRSSEQSTAEVSNTFEIDCLTRALLFKAYSKNNRPPEDTRGKSVAVG